MSALLALGFTATSHAIDLTALGVDIRMNPSHYRELLDRFEHTDTTLTNDEMATLYYGFPYTAEYAPVEKAADIENAYDLEDYQKAYDLATDALTTSPLSLALNVVALSAADHLNRTSETHIPINDLGLRCDLIATAILESGTGTSARSPFLVTDVADIDRVLRNIIGVESVVDRTKVGNVLAFKITLPGNDRQHILYFDVPNRD
jgi:hypothetical protein